MEIKRILTLLMMPLKEQKRWIVLMLLTFNRYLRTRLCFYRIQTIHPCMRLPSRPTLSNVDIQTKSHFAIFKISLLSSWYFLFPISLLWIRCRTVWGITQHCSTGILFAHNVNLNNFEFPLTSISVHRLIEITSILRDLFSFSACSYK